MGFNVETAEQICTPYIRLVENTYRGLVILPVFHRIGRDYDEKMRALAKIADHPAYHAASHILSQPVDKAGASSFLGLATASGKIFFGLSSRDSYIAILTLNIDEFRKKEEMQETLLHLVSHALDQVERFQIAKASGKPMKYGPLIPKKSAIGRARSNLRADIFAATVISLDGTKEAMASLSRKRACECLIARQGHAPEDYPMLIAVEAANFRLDQLMADPPARAKIIETGRYLAQSVTKTFDEATIRSWWTFTDHAQNMAWRGHSKRQILGAAVNTSEDPQIRTTGYMIAEMTKIMPLSSSEITSCYNAFAENEVNERSHRQIADEVFEKAMTKGLETKASSPFRDAANYQNLDLLEGKVKGWCADALQAAGNAFEHAEREGRSGSQAAREEFDKRKGETTWSSIAKLGEKIIHERRIGNDVTLEKALEMASQIRDMRGIANSIAVTMNDSGYKQKLQAANDLEYKPLGPAPKAPSLEKLAMPKTPQPAMMLSPSLGIGGSAMRNIATTPQFRKTPEQIEKENSKET